MSDIKDKLNELRGIGGLMTGPEWRQRFERLVEQRQAGDFEIDKFVPGEVVSDGQGRFYRVRRDFPLDTRQGRIELGAVLETIPEQIALSACDPDLERFDPATALFLDVETTGLSGGTGTTAFLVGVGYFVQGVFRLEQCFMRDFDEEEAMLRYLDGIFARGATVVTFNGKSFDIPLLRTRFIANRMPFRLDAALHFDLVHAVRRIWRLRLGDCSLGNVERAVLGIQRHGDVASAEIPEIWLDYVRTRDARRLKAVFYHHQMDILSLAALTALLSQSLDAPVGEGFAHAEDRLSVVYLHFRQRRYEDVAAHARRLLESETTPDIRHTCLELLGFAYKRLQNWEQMQATWDLMMREFPKDLLARLELAKHHEHRRRDLIQAQRICIETIQWLETRAGLGHEDDFHHAQIAAFQHRLDRIQRKLAKTIPLDEPEDEPGPDIIEES